MLNTEMHSCERLKVLRYVYYHAKNDLNQYQINSSFCKKRLFNDVNYYVNNMSYYFV